MVKDPDVFAKIAQAATPLMVACYIPHIDKFINQHQQEIEAKKEKLAQWKSILEMMELSNLPCYKEEWGGKDNKERYPLAIWLLLSGFSLKERCGNCT